MQQVLDSNQDVQQGPEDIEVSSSNPEEDILQHLTVAIRRRPHRDQQLASAVAQERLTAFRKGSHLQEKIRV